MSRYYNTMQTPGPAEYYALAINQYMMNEGFALVEYKGQQVWKKGIGLLLGPQFFSIQYQGNFIYLSAFIRFVLIPGVYFGEEGLEGFVGAIPKNMLKERVVAIERYIMSLWQPNYQQTSYMQPQPPA